MYETTHMPIQRVIVVDHDTETTRLIAELLTDEGFATLCYPAWLLSVACIEQAQASLLILELGLGESCMILDLLGELRHSTQLGGLPIIIMSTDDRQLARMEQPLRELGCRTLAKPFDVDDFLLLISKCLDMNRGSARWCLC
jgi:DNA-binding response OmpR family regulator